MSKKKKDESNKIIKSWCCNAPIEIAVICTECLSAVHNMKEKTLADIRLPK